MGARRNTSIHAPTLYTSLYTSS